MRGKSQSKTLTLGELIETVYHICGNRNARGIIRLALDAHVVVLREHHRRLGGWHRRVTW